MDGLDTGLKQGATLPASWYRDPEVLEREFEAIFAREWQYVGWVGDVRGPGDYVTSYAGRVPVVVLRDDEMALRGYVNVCPHRFHEVASGSGCRRVLQCNYHGWTYGLDGRLRGAPRSDREPKFDRDDIGLRPIQVDTWGPLLFVNPSLDAPPLSTAMAGMPELAEERGFDMFRHPRRARREWMLDCNWKVTLDNNTECYHCATVHPGFRAEYHVDRDHYEVKTFGRGFSHESPMKVAGDDEEWSDFHLYYLWPNFMMSARGNSYFYTYTYRPIDATHTLQVNDYYLPSEWSDEQVEEKIEALRELQAEDWSVYHSAQRGIASGMLERGRILPVEEALLVQMQRLCYEAVSASQD